MLTVKAMVAALAMAGSPCEPGVAPDVEFIIAFGEVEAQADYFPHQLRLFVVPPPGDCLHIGHCNARRAYVAIIGDGELPDYRVFDLGCAADWRFIEWGERPANFHDDARDEFTLRLRRSQYDPAAAQSHEAIVRVSFSLHSDAIRLEVER